MSSLGTMALLALWCHRTALRLGTLALVLAQILKVSHWRGGRQQQGERNGCYTPKLPLSTACRIFPVQDHDQAPEQALLGLPIPGTILAPMALPPDDRLSKRRKRYIYRQTSKKKKPACAARGTILPHMQDLF